MTISDLYGKSFKWIEYKTTYADSPMTATMKMEMLGREMHDGKMMDHMRMTTNFGAQTTGPTRTPRLTRIPLRL